MVLQNKSLFPCGKHVSGIHRFASLIHYSTVQIGVQKACRGCFHTIKTILGINYLWKESDETLKVPVSLLGTEESHRLELPKSLEISHVEGLRKIY